MIKLSALKTLCRALPCKTPGKVTLVGAGPGDAELLTVKAVNALQAADIILCDDLVSQDVLELANPKAKLVSVGKRGGQVSCKQDDINELMLNFAKSGNSVVRLKSGDPSIFGRAGEEIECLEAHNISVAIVPGITSASAMAAQLGVSLTHRDHAQSVQFITGHSRLGELPENLHWESLAHTSTTSIFYMGGRTAAKIKQNLTAHGMPESTPVTVCSSVSRANTTQWFGMLSELEAGVKTIEEGSPVLIGVGGVFTNKNAQSIDEHSAPVQSVSSVC